MCPFARRVTDLCHELAPRTLAYTDEHRVLLVVVLLLLHLLQGGEGSVGQLPCRSVLVETEELWAATSPLISGLDLLIPLEVESIFGP
jgi:hypothetical protein